MVSLLIVAIAAETRPFRMGFTPWPSEMSASGLEQTRRFMDENGDVTAVMLLGGVPWPEAEANRPFSPSLRQQLAYRPAPGKSVFLSVSPLSINRRELAGYWGERENMPLPTEWQNLAFDDPKVTRSFTRFTIRSIDALKPMAVAIGVESNALLTYAPEKWPAYRRFHERVYRDVKRRFPTLPVFFTTEVNHFLGRSQGSTKDRQRHEVSQLMRHSDWFAMSYYPHMTLDTPWPIPENALNFARQFRKPIAVTETGMNSQPVAFPQVTLLGSKEKQRQYYDVLLNSALRDQYHLVISFCTTDFERLLPALPPPDREIASIWTYSGLQTSAGTLKPAGERWRQVFRLPYRR